MSMFFFFIIKNIFEIKLLVQKLGQWKVTGGGGGGVPNEGMF